MESKWDAGYNLLNRKVYRAKLLGTNWCPRCKVQIEEPVPRYLLRLEVEDSTISAFFVALDFEVQKMVQLPSADAVAKGEAEGFAAVAAAFEPLISVFKDYLIVLTPYNMKTLETPTFTVAKLPSTPTAPDAPQSSVITKNIHTKDERLSEEELAYKKPCIQEMPVSTSASTVVDA
ncbi:hypothetical protein MKX01_004772 [Papaver californicum]|nr:hypothetical protein MKX01_004772 [Papaver californicum]